MLSLQEKTAERSPPFSPPAGTAMTSLSRPASSRERCARSLPAHSSMQPKGRMAVREQLSSCGWIFLNFISVWMPVERHRIHLRESAQALCELGISHVWLLKIVRGLKENPGEMRRLQAYG